MSRVDNYVHISGKVIKGPKPLKQNGTDVPKARFQVEIRPRHNDKGLTFKPFVVSYGKQAEKDLKNLKPGDYVEGSGRIITHYIDETRFFMRKDGSSTLIEVDPDNLPSNFNEDKDELFDFQDQGLKTEIQADDVKYWHDIIAELTEEELSNAFSPKMLMKVLEIREKNAKEEQKRKEEEQKN